jgi:hypothetical protein
MNRPTLHTLARLLTPWRTIRRLEAENQRLREQAVAGPAYRLRKCPTHGQQPPNAWGCPECVRQLRGELATVREAVRRLVRWSLESFDRETVKDIYNWHTRGMTGPLAPLPDHIAKREQPTTTENQP